jgi:CubicO group peptidase (beta-lactamase class C family)
MTLDTQHPAIQAVFDVLDAQLAAEQAARKIPGLAAGLVFDQELVWSKGYGFANVERQIPADANSVYRVASITKLFTSTMMMILRDEGKLSLDDPVEKYLPAFRIKSRFPGARPITFRQLASHGAGIPREGAHTRWKTMDMPTIDELLASLADLECIYPTMTEPKYSNLGIAILGHTLSVIAGQPYDQFVTERVLKPLGMMSSGYNRAAYGEDRYAVGYYWARRGQLEAAPHWDEQGFRPGGGMYSTVADMARFIALQFRDGAAGGAQILSGATLREMHSPALIGQDFEMAYGIAFRMRKLAGYKAIGHSGGLPGWSTNITLIPSLKIAAIAFANTGTDPDAISIAMLESLIPAVKRAAAPPRPTLEQLSGLQRYVGQYYWLTQDEPADVRIVNDALTFGGFGAPPNTYVTLIPHDEGRFLMKGGSSDGELAIFETDEAGNVTGLMLGAYPLIRKHDKE